MLTHIELLLASSEGLERSSAVRVRLLAVTLLLSISVRDLEGIMSTGTTCGTAPQQARLGVAQASVDLA